MAQSKESDRPVNAVDTSFRIIETIKERNGAQLTEIAEALDLPKSTVSDHVVTLRHDDYLVKNGKEYRIGLRFLELGDHARNYRNIYNIGKQKVDKLADETDGLVHLSVEENGRGVIIYETAGDGAVSLDTYVGRQVPMHCTALGKSMLAFMSESRVTEIVEQVGLSALTEQTITSQKELFNQLADIREQGYATSSGERITELGSVAAPIKDNDRDEVFGAVSICVPMMRMETELLETQVPDMARQAANRIELDLIYR
jgi:DNA-binding IclR family transcriptional regulator